MIFASYQAGEKKVHPLSDRKKNSNKNLHKIRARKSGKGVRYRSVVWSALGSECIGT